MSEHHSLIAQLVEQRTVNPFVPGSSPGRGAIFSPALNFKSACIKKPLYYEWLFYFSNKFQINISDLPIFKTRYQSILVFDISIFWKHTLTSA